MDIMDPTNAELEEMGYPPQCRCLAMYREVHDSTGEIYDVCADCGAERHTGMRVAAWSL